MDETFAKQLIDQNLKVYNTIAHKFSETRQFLWEELKPLKRFVKPGDTVLDLGCGNGRLYQMFLDLKIAYIGVDQSEELLALARKNFPAGEFLCGSMTQIPVLSLSVDVLYCIAAFQHVPTHDLQLQALFEMKRVLKPSGTLILTNWNLYSDWAQRQLQTGKYQQIESGEFLVPWRDASGALLGERYYHAFTPEELEGLLVEAGFVLLDQYYALKDQKSDQNQGENIVTIARLR